MFKFAVLALLVVSASALPKRMGAPRLTDKRIVGGEEASPGEFPSQVSVHIFGGHACGGSLLSENAVLTAGHCCAYSVSQYEVVAGEHNISEDEASEQRSDVEEIRQHEAYDDFSLQNDICILVLSSPITQNDVIQAVELAAADSNEPADLELLVVTGWGTTEEGGNLPDILQKVDVPYVPNERCAEEYDGVFSGVDVTDGMLCAGNEDAGGVDACQGDSGGPIFLKNDDGSAGAQVGLTSWGYGCARPGYPGVYTRTTYYMDWIDSNKP